MSLSGSVAFAVKSTDRVALAVQLGELVPGGQGSVIEALDDETDTDGGEQAILVALGERDRFEQCLQTQTSARRVPHVEGPNLRRYA